MIKPIPQTPLVQPENPRAIDPNVLQNHASNPSDSVWVSASAGSGKTKVLTDRILRLLLPDKDNQNATQPHKILALTFTKAGAGEMILRLRKKLSEWAVLENDKLENELKNLLGFLPTKDQSDAARKLFANVIDTPGGLKIMTIHSFCQSILGKFPLEAGINPNFKPLEEKDASQYIKKAIEKIFIQAGRDKGSPLHQAVDALAVSQNQDQLYQLLEKIISERKQFLKILRDNFGVEGLYTGLCKEFDVPAGTTPTELINQSAKTENFHDKDLRTACVALLESDKKTDVERGISLQNWLDSSVEERTKNFNLYKSNFLTTENTLRKALATKNVVNANPDILTILEIEAARIFALEQSTNALNIANISRDLFMIGEQVIEIYEGLKEKESALDFDDLILKTLDLLKGNTPQFKGLRNSVAWVRFKLDQGIDHILLDEAQDTNPEQWQILEALCGDFFDGDGASEQTRTLFVVGDEKQSIYSFQRASPEKFTEMQSFFGQKINNAQKQFQNINFNISFRSTQAVLKLVDQIFSDNNIAQGLGIEPIRHDAYRRTQAGMVELWPLFENPEKQNQDPWALPINITESTSGAAQMAAHVGDTIKGWLENKEILESYDRPITPGDIMILVRSRTAFLDQLIRALKIREIPVNGIDRMVLNDQLVIQDLYAAAQFALLPEDDLTLAALLKSPFIGWDEEQLFQVAHDREASLWAEVQKSNNDHTIKWLSELISSISGAGAYDFFMALLQDPCPADKISGLRAIKKRLGEETTDPIEAFLDQAANYDQKSISTIQNFIQEQLYQSNQIKREMDEAGNTVRIMTVHAAKGLQAPIVILPDTVRTSNSNKPDQLLWPDRTKSDLPYFCPQSKNIPPSCENALTILKQRQSEEYRRLLYVALTRAESRLYVGGYKATIGPIDDSWYRYVERGFELLETIKATGQNNIEVMRYVHHATDKPDRADKKEEKIFKNDVALPNWVFETMPEEPQPAKPLMPSRPSVEEDLAALSPLQAKDNNRFLRGNITHKLLQILPDLPVHQRQLNAKKYVALKSHNISKSVQEDIIREVMAILENPDFAAIFGEGSVAEAPITGMIEHDRVVSGQIDRLLVTDREILIIDYKSNRPAPKDIQNVPAIYYKQMKTYADVMRRIYPRRSIRCALIWTDGARLMELPDI